MAEYIEREAFIADIEKRYCRPCEAEGKDYNHVRCRACWVDDMVGEIEEAPAADVAPVVHGEWRTVTADDGTLTVECTECDAVFDEVSMFEFALNYNYCPNCGADMRGE